MESNDVNGRLAKNIFNKLVEVFVLFVNDRYKTWKVSIDWLFIVMLLTSCNILDI